MSSSQNGAQRDATGAVLVFGSNRDERLAAQRTIASHGYRVLLASNMAEAAKCLASGRVRAIVLTDSDSAVQLDGGPVHSAPNPFHDDTSIPHIRHHAPPGAAGESAVLALMSAVKAALA